MTASLDELMADALEHLPAPAKPKKAEIGPSLPARTQHHTPIEAESRFIRFAAWWEETECSKCQHIERLFDGIYEERDWIKDHEGGPKHWLCCTVVPLPELTKDAISYVRYYKRDFCAQCSGAWGWPLAQRFKEGEIVS
jgi:hypothetical protein